jgi:hypothetical protein
MYEVTITGNRFEYGTNREIFTVETTSSTCQCSKRCERHVCDTLSWFGVDKAREYAAEMSSRYLDAPIVDKTIKTPIVETVTNEAGREIGHIRYSKIFDMYMSIGYVYIDDENPKLGIAHFPTIKTHESRAEVLRALQTWDGSYTLTI